MENINPNVVGELVEIVNKTKYESSVFCLNELNDFNFDFYI